MRIMRWLILIGVFAASGCASVPSRGIDWTDWTEKARAAGKMKDASADPSRSFLSASTLIDNFEKIGFTFETRTVGTRNRTGEQFKAIRKWQRPLQYSVVSPADTLGRIRQPVERFMQRLAGITGHPIGPAQGGGLDLLKWSSDENMDDRVIVMFGSDGFYHDISRGRQNAPDNIRRFVKRWRLSASPCAGFVRHGSPSQPFTGPLTSVVIAIRDEIPQPLLQACIEEELAQSMGLFDDDPSVAPSLFNDDQEYGALTRHDELLLQILYDKRLKPGMSPEQAMPFVRRIAAELLPDA